MAVESGRINMLTACQQYEISARTFYRWLRNKDRLIELTGFSEADFKNGSPLPDKDSFPHQNTQRMPSQRTDEAASSRMPSKDPPHGTYAGSKRRLPRQTDKDTSNANQNPTYYRRSFLKMPSQAKISRENAQQQQQRAVADAQSASQIREKPRETWPQPPGEIDTQFSQFEPNAPSSPDESFKRRKIQKDDEPAPETVPDANDPLLVSTLQPDVTTGDDPPYVNGTVNHAQVADRGGGVPSEGVEGLANGTPASPSPENEFTAPISETRLPRKHRLEIMMGRRKVCIAWFDGATSEDIKATIQRRFALLPGTQWALMDKVMDEIVISPGVPSGKYTLTVFS